jgi:hypothetical protein
MQRYKDNPFDEHGLLKDGHVFKVPHRMLDGMQRDIARRSQQSRASDSTAFPRRGGRTFVTAADGGTMNLHKPGFRVADGGSAGTKALRDAVADERERARDRYLHDISNAWRNRDEWPQQAEDDDAEVEARAGAIRNALLSRGADSGDVDDYLDNCDDDDLLNQDLGEHITAFEQSLNGRDVANARQRRLDALYQQRNQELANAWRKNK